MLTAPKSFTKAQSFLYYTNSLLALELRVKNILLRTEDSTLLKDAEEDEFKHLSSRKVTAPITVFETRDLCVAVKEGRTDAFFVNSAKHEGFI